MLAVGKTVNILNYHVNNCSNEPVGTRQQLKYNARVIFLPAACRGRAAFLEDGCDLLDLAILAAEFGNDIDEGRSATCAAAIALSFAVIRKSAAVGSRRGPRRYRRVIRRRHGGWGSDETAVRDIGAALLLQLQRHHPLQGSTRQVQSACCCRRWSRYKGHDEALAGHKVNILIAKQLHIHELTGVPEAGTPRQRLVHTLAQLLCDVSLGRRIIARAGPLCFAHRRRAKRRKKTRHLL